MTITAWSVVLRSARPPFLLLTPVMIALAAAAATSSGQLIHWSYLPWIVLASLSAAIASNLLNEYFDFVSGLDHITQPTPFSGGSKALIQSPQHVEWVKWSGLLLVSVSVWTGLYLSAQVGWGLLLLGVIGVALVIGYTPIINRQPLLCLLAPGLGYGLVMFLGSYVALVGHLDATGFMLLPIPVLLVSALLLLNQFPDADLDRQVGRLHAVITWGKARSRQIWLALHGLSWLWLAVLVALAWVDQALGLALLAIGLVIWLWFVKRSKAILQRTDVPLMAVNVAVVLLMPLLIAGLLVLSQP